MADFRLGRLKFNWRGAWAPSTAYVIDDIVSFKGNTYVCVVNHTSAASETGWASTDLNIATPRWQLHVPGIRIMGPWAPNTFYAKNDLVTFGANQYLCVTDHTSPANESQFYSSQINWVLYTSGTEFKGNWANGVYYKINDIVKYGNGLYVCISAHTSGISYDPSKFNSYLETLKFENTWSGGQEYQPGDIVTFGGYSYVAKTIHTNKQPNLYSSDWDILTTGFRMQGDYNNSTIYVPGDVVRFGGDTYVKISTSAAGIYPIDTSRWQKVTSGLNWRGPWNSSSTYQVNDVVSKQSASWVNLTAHNTNIDPVEDQTVSTEVKTWNVTTTTTIVGAASQSYSGVASTSNGSGTGATFNISRNGSGVITTITAVNKGTGYAIGNTVTIAGANIGGSTPGDNLVLTLTAVGTGTGGANWQAVAQGESTLTLQDPGDTLYRNAAGANVNLPIGTNGQILTVNNGLPSWERNNLCANVYYVATDGTDATTHGRNISRPWKTLKYALSQIPAGSAANINTIFVKSGTYEEQLPLTVPAYTSIVGDNLRSSIIAPKSTGLSTDATPVENRFSTMFYLSESTTLKDLVFTGMEGFEPAGGANSSDITQATVRGVFLRLNPASVILGKSPYITQCSAFSGRPVGDAPNCTGGVGALVDRSVYGGTTSNGSMLFDSFTQFHDGGVGFWCKDQGNAEVVSCFTYYAHIGYTCTGGGRIRSLAGNNSWGTFGAVSRGFDLTETALAANVRGQRLNFVYGENSALFVKGEQVQQSTLGQPDYALGLILYEQSTYLIIEAITGTFQNSKPITGIGAAGVSPSGAVATTAAVSGENPNGALEGLKGKIFPLTGLPVVGGQAVLPQITGATKFLNVSGSPQFNDTKYYVIKGVEDASTAQNLTLSTVRRYDNPGTAPQEVNITSVARTNNVATVTTSSAHGLSTGDKVNIVIAPANYQTFATLPFQRTEITVTSGTQFTYANSGGNVTTANIAGSKVYKQGTSGGTTLATHTGGTSVTLYNVSSSTTLLDNAGTQELSDSATTVPFADATILSGISSGANNFILVNNELMNITGIQAGVGVTVTRGNEGTSAAAHADGSVIYYVTKSTNATTIRQDVDTAGTTIPIFSIANFDANDIIKIDNEFLRISSVNSTQVGRATLIFANPKTINTSNGQSVEIRLRYSQVRMTGHDFLQVGTGRKSTTNWPGTPTQSAVQANEVVEDFPGRVYYVSTDQDGNFRVGEFFTVEQATGSATLDATAFNLAGLASLRLGSLGAELGVSINEFSADATLGGDFSRDTAVPTQLAVKTYVDGAVGAGIVRTSPSIGVATITSSGTTATVTSFVAHNVYQGDEIVISGANQANYNGTFIVASVPSALTFTYVMSGNAVTPATGTFVCNRKQKIADSNGLDLRGNLKIQPTWNSSSTTFRGLDIDVTNTSSATPSYLVDVKIGGSSKFTVDKDGNGVFGGNLTVAGTTTTINSTDLAITDKTIVIGDGTASAASLDGAGIRLGTAASGLSLYYNNTNTRYDFGGGGINIPTSRTYQINGTNVLSATTLGSGVTASSLTSVGTLTGLTVSGVSNFASVNEGCEIRSNPQSGNQTYDYSLYTLFYHPGVNGDITVNVSNVPTTVGKAYSISIVIAQGGTAYKIATSMGINGVNQTIKWANNSQPSGDASRHNVWTLSFVRVDGSTWQVYGQASSYQ